jgi:hypothetical protein
MEGRKHAYTVHVKRLDGKRPLERPGYRWKDIIKKDLQ